VAFPHHVSLSRRLNFRGIFFFVFDAVAGMDTDNVNLYEISVEQKMILFCIHTPPLAWLVGLMICEKLLQVE
jgi:hypothetical protein